MSAAYVFAFVAQSLCLAAYARWNYARGRKLGRFEGRDDVCSVWLTATGRPRSEGIGMLQDCLSMTETHSERGRFERLAKK